MTLQKISAEAVGLIIFAYVMIKFLSKCVCMFVPVWLRDVEVDYLLVGLLMLSLIPAISIPARSVH